MVAALMVVLTLAAGGFAFGQATGDDHLNKDFLVRFVKDFVGVFASPFHWSSQEVDRFALISGAALFSLTLDQKVMDWTQSHKTKLSRDVSKVVVNFGNGAYLLGFTGVLYAAGELWHSTGVRRTALLSLESFATASALVAATKIILGRARPLSGQYPFSFHLLSTRAVYNSFPSGHAAAAFAVATTIAEQTRSVAVDVAAYSLATLVGLSRIHDNEHWLSLVVAGAAVGYFVAKKINGSHARKGTSSGLNFGLQLGPQRQALALTYTF